MKKLIRKCAMIRSMFLKLHWFAVPTIHCKQMRVEAGKPAVGLRPEGSPEMMMMGLEMGRQGWKEGSTLGYTLDRTANINC